MLQKRRYVLGIAIGVAALMLLGAGSAKLLGVPEVHKSFAALGLPPWFGYFIGACEVAGAIGLLIRPLSALAAACLSLILIGALYYHATHTPLGQGVPALVLLCLCGFIFMRRREALFAFGRRTAV